MCSVSGDPSQLMSWPPARAAARPYGLRLISREGGVHGCLRPEGVVKRRFSRNRLASYDAPQVTTTTTTSALLHLLPIDLTLRQARASWDPQHSLRRDEVDSGDPEAPGPFSGSDL